MLFICSICVHVPAVQHKVCVVDVFLKYSLETSAFLYLSGVVNMLSNSVKKTQLPHIRLMESIEQHFVPELYKLFATKTLLGFENQI